MPSLGYSPTVILDWLVGGVDFSLAGNGGPGCAEFTPPLRRYTEMVFGLGVAGIIITWAYKNCTLPDNRHRSTTRRDRDGRKSLLAMVSLIFGMEIAYKLATKTVIFLLNPCHVITAVQIYLLAAPPSALVTALFRIHINFLNGAVLALLFPVTNTLFLPFETEVYFIQHFLMLVTPYYLLRVGGPYTMEKLGDFTWTFMSFAIMILYHFLVLFPIALPLEVNLSQMLCPAISDPFYGPDYRLWTLIHQAFFVPALTKTYTSVATYFITKFPLTRVKSDIEFDLGLLGVEWRTTNGQNGTVKQTDNGMMVGNGHTNGYNQPHCHNCNCQNFN